MTTRPGRQTLLYQIAHARRNGKEGLEWGELEPKDKIDRDALKQVKLFLTPLPDRDAVMWIDNIRLMQEDAAKPKLTVPLPAGALAYKFGSAGVKAPGFTTVTPDTEFPGSANCGFVDPKKLKAGGAGWPDGLSGTFVLPPAGRPAGVPRPRSERRLFRLAVRRPRHPQGIRGPSLSAARRRRGRSSTICRRRISITAASTSTASSIRAIPRNPMPCGRITSTGRTPSTRRA